MDLLDALEDDHRRLLGLLAAAESQPDAPSRSLILGRFLRGFRRHVQLEENVLFPALVRRLGQSIEAQLAAQEREHLLLCRMVEEIESLVESGATGPWSSDLFLALSIHQAEEERRIYRMAPGFLGEALPCDPSLLIDLGALA